MIRVAYGVALLIAPARVAGNRWLGPGARAPAAEVALRGLGAREVALHALAMGAYLRGRDARPLLAASIAGGSALLTAAAIAGASR